MTPKLIEPCCAKKHMTELRDSLAKGAAREIEGFGDLSLTELLPAILTRYSETTMLIAAPAIPDQAAEVIERWMRRQWARMDGKGKLDVVKHLTIITDLRRKKSPIVSTWLKARPASAKGTVPSGSSTSEASQGPSAAAGNETNPFPDRLTLIDQRGIAPADTALLLPDFAITGPINLRYGDRFAATATTDQPILARLWAKYLAMTEIPAEEQKSPEVPENPESPENPEPAASAAGPVPDGSAVGEESSE